MIQKILICLVILGMLFAGFKFLFNVFYGWIAIEIEKRRREESE